MTGRCDPFVRFEGLALKGSSGIGTFSKIESRNTHRLSRKRLVSSLKNTFKTKVSSHFHEECNTRVRISHSDCGLAVYSGGMFSV